MLGHQRAQYYYINVLFSSCTTLYSVSSMNRNIQALYSDANSLGIATQDLMRNCHGGNGKRRKDEFRSNVFSEYVYLQEEAYMYVKLHCVTVYRSHPSRFVHIYMYINL